MSIQFSADNVSALKQWMELSNEFIAALAQNEEFKYRLPDDWNRKLRLMETLVERLPGESDLFYLQPKFTCCKCDHMFEVPRRIDISDQKGYAAKEVCPECGCEGFLFSKGSLNKKTIQNSTE